MNGRNASLDRSYVAPGNIKILNAETRTLTPVNGYTNSNSQTKMRKTTD